MTGNKHINVCWQQKAFMSVIAVSFYWKLSLLCEQFHHMMRQFYICELRVGPDIKEMTTLMRLSGQWPALHSFCKFRALFIVLFTCLYVLKVIADSSK